LCRSDAGASPDEAISWGKIKRDAKPVKVFSDASLVFPILVTETFARHQLDFQKHHEQRKLKQQNTKFEI
jgi:deoxyhypusine synthase